VRILVTTDTVGGVWTYALTLVGALSERGHACFLAMLGEPSDEQLESLPADVEWEAAGFPLEWLPTATGADIAGATRWLQRLVRRWNADVAHLNQFAYAAEPLGAPAVVVAHSDVFSWFREVRDAEPGPEWEPYQRWVRAGLLGADAVVSPTCYQSRMLARHYGRAADRVIHNALAPRVAPAGRAASSRPWVFAAGRAWDEAKGIAVLDEALRRLGARAPSAHLAGSLDGPAGERYVPRRLNAHGQVTREAMDRLYGNASLYIATSLYEPFGLAPLEAAGHGCALLLADIGSFRELWDDAAAFVPPGSPDALAAEIEALMEDPARLDGLAAAAAARAAERYTAERMVEEYCGLYARLTSGRKGVLIG
jgi:glycogen(starch) synthase